MRLSVNKQINVNNCYTPRLFRIILVYFTIIFIKGINCVRYEECKIQTIK